jgi:hypothetical protein
LIIQINRLLHHVTYNVLKIMYVIKDKNSLLLQSALEKGSQRIFHNCLYSQIIVNNYITLKIHM